MLDLKGKRVVVVGLARSGLAASKLLASLGAQVTVSDQKPAEALAVDMGALRSRGIIIETGGHRPETFLRADLIVTSPGVDLRMPLLQEVKAKGVPVIGEAELAYQASRARFIGITGTKGKGTTATILGRILERAGFPVVVAGNIGTPLSEVAPAVGPEGWVVAELSSFQLEAIDRFHPHGAVLLNLAPDHLDRYPSVEEYYAAKALLFKNQGPSDFAVVNADDEKAKELSQDGRARRLLFSRHSPVEEGAFLDGGVLLLSRSGRRTGICRVGELKVPGLAMVENALAAAAAAAALEVEVEAMAEALRTFPGREHCLEFVGVIDGVRYYNDSKATNVFAVVKALEGFESPVILIAGGRDKREDFTPLKPLVRDRVKALILLGEAREKIRATLDGLVPVEEADSMEEAVAKAAAAARVGDAVLLSPGCASFDMFTSAEDRGYRFKQAVLKMSSQPEAYSRQLKAHPS